MIACKMVKVISKNLREFYLKESSMPQVANEIHGEKLHEKLGGRYLKTRGSVWPGDFVATQVIGIASAPLEVHCTVVASLTAPAYFMAIGLMLVDRRKLFAGKNG
jgi:hypothetical protein